MSKDNSDFFKKKQIWSEVKDQLLGCYLKPYMQKILATRCPVFYVDCFAGKGRFDDGSDGSPRIALDIIDSCLNTTTNQNAKVESCYIDLHYAEDLKANLTGYKNVSIVSGKYEDNIIQLLQNRRRQNIFLYIDPYGIKALNCEFFDKFSQLGFNSIELLINMNSFGFMREACRVKQVSYSGVESFADIIEYEPTTLSATAQSVNALNEIAGGDYWEKIVEDYNAKRIDGYEAEESFAKQYCDRLHQKYNYVLNMPIRLRQGQRPKYRMIHATNHADGCVLMYENICKRWEVLEEIQNNGQFDLFSTTVDGKVVNTEEIETLLCEHLARYSKDTPINVILAEFFTKHGVLCEKSDIISELQLFEERGSITVTRCPSTTKNGAPRKFFTESSKQHLKIRSST